MIAYLQKTVDELNKCLAEGKSEEWMKDAILMETAIITELNKSQFSTDVTRINTPIAFNEDAIGNNIKVKVKLLHEIEVLKERLQGSQQPDVNYATLLHEKQEELKWTNETLRDLKQKHKLHLQQRLATIDREIEESFDAFHIDEMNSIRRQMLTKIEAIDAELKTL